MIAYRLELDNSEHIDIYFEPQNICEVTVSDKKTYLFSYENGELVIKIKMKSTTNTHEFDFKSVKAIEPNNIKKFSARKPSTNCCSIGPKEWCIKHGCMDAPCGRICD